LKIRPFLHPPDSIFTLFQPRDARITHHHEAVPFMGKSHADGGIIAVKSNLSRKTT
jgi:hypothetical protein